MGFIDWILDVSQHSKIDDVRREAMESRLEAARVNQGGSVDAQRLERALGELVLVTKTIQRLMVEKGVCAHDELRDTVQCVDAEDGRRDGHASI